MNWLQRAGAKALGIKFLPQAMMENRRLKRTRIDYRAEVGDLIDASVVTAPVQWIQRSLPEARLTVRKRSPSGKVEEVADHPMLALIQKPNPYYGDLALWSGTAFSYLTAGNAYWIKLRKGTHLPGELWYVPHWTMEPKWPEDGSVFISHYEYRPGSGHGVIKYAPEDVVHFRHGIDPRNTRKGLSPLDGVIREIFMDLESSNFVSALLRNSGVPGMVISPKTGGTVPAEDVAATKAWLRQAFGGDRRGEPLVMGAPTDVYPYGFNPQQMNMGEARDIAEERVCACLGTPAAVVGFGAGLQSTKVGATMEELRKLAWENGVLPPARVFADELDRSLLPDFGTVTGLTSWWDTTDVRALQDDRGKAATTWNTMINGGWAEVAEGREGMGLEVNDSHRVFLRPAMALEVPGGSKGLSRWVEKARRLFGGETKAQAGRRPREAGRAFVVAVQRQEEALASAMDKRLSGFFAELGSTAKAAALAELEAANWKAAAGHEEKADDILVSAILERLGLDTHRTTFQRVFESHFIDVAKKVSEAAGLAGISGSLPDPVARTIAAAGGRRAGLIDLGDQTRSALFDAIALGRADGEGVAALATRIAQHIEAGPWTTIEQRSRTIARTETKYAQNVSTIERAKSAGVAQFIVFDGRFGPGRSKPDHIARDGSIVTAEVADRMAAEEHPNGTLSFAPYFGED